MTRKKEGDFRTRFTYVTVLAIAMICGFLFPHTGNAQTKPDALGFDRSVFDWHFEMADREITPEQWMRQAREGVSMARSAWERMALELYAEPELRLAAEKQVDDWSEAELEKRFSDWLVKRFLGSEAEKVIRSISTMASDTGVGVIYHRDENGTILYNETTGDPEIIRPGESDFSVDKDNWLAQTTNFANNEITAYAAKLDGLYPELLSYIPEDRRDDFTLSLDRFKSDGLSYIQSELNRIISREERIITAQRLGDVWSLRKKSEDQAASALTSALISEAQNMCEQGIADLQERIEAAEAYAGDLALAGGEWLALYQEQFNIGLKAWEEAEERFFISRLEWERDAGENYRQGIETWQAAYQKFIQEREAWEKQTQRLLESGEALFASASHTLESAIAEARVEFHKNASLRVQSGTDRANAYIDMYLTSVSAANSAQDNISFWIGQYDAGNQDAIPAISDAAAFEAWLLHEEKNADATSADNPSLQEIRNWYELYASYKAKIVDTKQSLAAEFDLVMGEGILTGVLDAGTGSEDFNLDEYQIALIKAKAAVAYWEKQTAMAQAVLQYAVDASAGRSTASESAKAWEDAKKAYDDAVLVYGETQRRLLEAGSDVQSVKLEMDAAAQKMQEASAALETLNADYAAILSASVIKDKTFLFNQIVDQYKELAKSQQAIRDVDFLPYLESAYRFDESNIAEKMGGMLKQLVLGNAEYGKPLIELADNVNSIITISQETPLPETIQDFGIAADNPAYEAIETLLNERENNRLEIEANSATADGADDPDVEIALEQIEQWYRERIIEQVSLASAWAEEQLAERIQIIRSLDPAIMAEQYENAVLAIQQFFLSLGVQTNGAYFPDIHEIISAIFKDNAGIEEISSFLSYLDNQFVNLPSWINDEYSVWKASFIAYTSAYFIRNGIEMHKMADAILEKADAVAEELQNADSIETYRKLYNTYILLQYEYECVLRYGELREQITKAENAGEKCWREYITSEIVENAGGTPQTSDSVTGASSYKDGILLDNEARLAFETRKLNAALSYEGNGDTIRPMFSIAEQFIANNAEEWNESYVIPTNYMLQDAYTIEEGKLNRLFTSQTSQQKSFRQTGLSYEYASAEVALIYAVKNQKMNEIEAQRIFLNTRAAEYAKTAQAFAEKGAAYDAAYTGAKDAYAAMENARSVYETQDAVRRWALAAYLETAGAREDFEYAQERCIRARTALDSLASLYSGQERLRAYNDSEYNALYAEYEASFTRLTETALAQEAVNKKASELIQENQTLYEAYQAEMELWIGNRAALGIMENYTSGADKTAWSLKDIISVENGTLRFSYDDAENFILEGSDSEDSLRLYEYLYGQDGDRNNQPQIECETRLLNERMQTYITDIDAYKNFALARDYLIRMLTKNNSDIAYLQDKYSTTDALHTGSASRYMMDKFELFTSHSNTSVEEYISELNRDYTLVISTGDDSSTAVTIPYGNLFLDQKAAWERLNDQQRQDMEMYLILTLVNGGGSDGWLFSEISELSEYKYVCNATQRNYQYFKEFTDASLWWLLTITHLVKADARDTLAHTYNSLNTARQYIETNVNEGFNGFQSSMRQLQETYRTYQKSCDAISQITGENEQSDPISWSDIALSLANVGYFEDKINLINGYWNAFSPFAGSFSSVPDALTQLAQWAKSENAESKRKFDQEWADDEQRRREAEQPYFELTEAYIAGAASLKAVKEAAKSAFGENAASRKIHLKNIENALSHTLNDENHHMEAYIAEEYANLITRAYNQRYTAELEAREAEWMRQSVDLRQKAKTWLETASLIQDRGKADWERAGERFMENYNQWIKTFEEEYKKNNDAWQAAYLNALQNKEAWVERATEAANNAATGAMLALVGADAHAMSRVFDTGIPITTMHVDAEAQAGAVMTELLASTGIANMEQALGNLNDSFGSIATAVRTGAGGVNIWNAGTVRATVNRLVSETNAELAEREAKRLAANVKNAGDNAVAELTRNVLEANVNFRKNMDDTFVTDGQWKKSGHVYIKDVLVHSTFSDPVITETAHIEGYHDYHMPVIEIQTDLSPESLDDLDSFMVQIVINNIYKEMQDKRNEIFGSDSSEKGLFGLWIGDAPVVKKGADPDEGKNSMFEEGSGSGEQGRLLTEFIYWQFKESMGIQAINTATWDKPMWDSRGSFIEAPSLRVVGEIAMSVAASVATFGAGGAVSALLIAGLETAAINMVDDAVFAFLDVSAGYKSATETMVDLGKKALVSVASSTIGAAFNASNGLASIAVSKAAPGFDKVLTQTLMSGTQNVVSGIVTSPLNAITYNDSAGFGFSNAAYNKSMTGSLISAASGMTSAFTTGVLSHLNTGATGEKLLGFSIENESDVVKFNRTLGSAAGEGINYAFTGDFSLNLLNTGYFTQNQYSMGLLELRLGKNGAKMNMGSGGVDISMGTLASVIRGMDVINTNSKIEEYVKTHDFKSAVSLRVQYGYGDETQKAFLSDLLTGNADINIVEHEKGALYRAETKLENGKRVVNLTGYTDSLSIKEQMFQGILLGHEAYRNGIVDMNNVIETNRAVLGHTEMAIRMLQDGRSFGNDSQIISDINAYFKSRDDPSQFYMYTEDVYDSSADYWKLISKSDGTHVLEWDKKKDLTIEYQDKGEDGEWETVSSKVITMDNARTMGQSLVQILGEDRALSLIMANGAFSHYADSLKSLSNNKRQQTMGEYLMTLQGMSFDKNVGHWNETSRFTLTDRTVDGYILVNKTDGGTLDTFTVSATLYRQTASYDAKQGLGVQATAENNKALDAITFRKQDLNGNVLNLFKMTGVQSVDVYNTFDKEKGVSRDQPTNLITQNGSTLQGNTVMSGFSLRMLNMNSAYPVLIHNAKTLDGDVINKYGVDGDPGGAWFIHSSTYQVSDGCFIVTDDMQNLFLKTMASWGVSQGDEIRGTLINQ
ncbi:MAG: hypothetical protein LBG43_05650 [Treponema sp.]|jgi:hypothetical protein|nr:hypothetical protein [Treponema sp.]